MTSKINIFKIRFSSLFIGRGFLKIFIIYHLFFSFYHNQLSMSVLANVSNLSSGMGLGFPAITFQTLTNPSDPMALTNDEASWFGEYIFF